MVRLWNSKGSGNFLRINCVSLTNLHTQHVVIENSYIIEQKCKNQYLNNTLEQKYIL